MCHESSIISHYFLFSSPSSIALLPALHRSLLGMGFLHLFIVNKSGGLILHRPLGPTAPKISTNEWLRIGSTFHSLYAIAAEASPVKLPGNKNSGERAQTTFPHCIADIHIRCFNDRCTTNISSPPWRFGFVRFKNSGCRWWNRTNWREGDNSEVLANQDGDQICAHVRSN